jgi:EAL domain-containing protein (putative c-di-GMP-specific phosphodiesterase class I)
LNAQNNNKENMDISRLVNYFDEWSSANDVATQLLFDAGGATGRHNDLALSSVFQPLLDSATRKAIAYEALLRVSDKAGLPVAPDVLFRSMAENSGVVALDRLCRVIHSINFFSQAQGDLSLFLNINGRHLLGIQKGTHGAAFETLLRYCCLKPSQVVLEILESEVDSLENVQIAIDAYKGKGFRIAIDDFGCRHSNFDRLWILSPDIVKLDRSLIVQADHNPRAAKMLPSLVRLIHELGAQVVCEGIETPAQHARAVDSGVDLLQGYHYARPHRSLIPQVADSQRAHGVARHLQAA